MAKSRSSNRKLVPQSSQVLDQWKYEIAAELGLPVGTNAVSDVNSEFASELGATPNSNREDYWGHIATRDTGSVGGEITRRLVQKAQETLFK